MSVISSKDVENTIQTHGLDHGGTFASDGPFVSIRGNKQSLPPSVLNPVNLFGEGAIRHG
jgi:hypothetical protein